MVPMIPDIICEFCKFHALMVDGIPFRNCTEMKSQLQINMIVAMCEGGGIGRGDLNCNVYTVEMKCNAY